MDVFKLFEKIKLKFIQFFKFFFFVNRGNCKWSHISLKNNCTQVFELYQQLGLKKMTFQLIYILYL